MTAMELSRIIGMVDDDIIEDCMAVKSRRPLKIFIIAAVVCAMAFTTAFALSPEFRHMLISVFSPVYDEEAFTAIDEGHRTGNFDEDDVIMTFLSHLEQEENITIKTENGYDYDINEISENIHEVLVHCPDDVTEVILRVENIPYKETTGLWQVTGYNMITE